MIDDPIDQTKDGALQAKAVPAAAAILGAAGVIPFVAGALAIMFADISWAYDMLRYYAASILSFMGGVQWGAAMTGPHTGDLQPPLWRKLANSVMPALIAWMALLFTSPYDLMIIAAAFGLLLMSDLVAIQQGWLPAWYARLRLPLTGVVIVCLMIAAFVLT